MPPMSNTNPPAQPPEEAFSTDEMRRLISNGQKIRLDGAIALAVENAKEKICDRSSSVRKTLYAADTTPNLGRMLIMYAEEELSMIRPCVHDWYDWEEAHGLLGREAQRHVVELYERLDIDDSRCSEQ